jgi:hypothetical protein
VKTKKRATKQAEPALNKPFRTPGGSKKFAVYVKDPSTGNRKKVSFGDPNMSIKRDDPEARKNFRARHGCDNPGPKTKAKYWSCRMWSTKPVSKITKEDETKTIEPAWAKDEDTWARAKKAAGKGDADDPWALTTYLYKRMGGKVGGKKKEAAKPSQPGVPVTRWFFGCEAFAPSTQPPTSDTQNAPASLDAPAKHEPTIDEEIAKLLIENPGISGATMVNLLKAKGFKIVDDKQIEADGLSTAVATTRAEPKESGIQDHFIRARFLESAKDNGVGPVRFKVALIQEGLGNLRDAFYYTRDAIESGVLAFEGKKCYADHPSRSEESDRPERSVRDIIGHFENVHVEDGDQGQAMLCADLVMLPDPPFEWARSLVRHSIDYSKTHPDKEFVGLSINAAGDAETKSADDFVKETKIPDAALPKLKSAMQDGLTQVRVVSAIRDAVSTDLVTEPGARGKVLEILEGDRPMKKKATLFAEDEKKLPAKQEEKKMKHSEDEAKHESEDEAKEEKPEGDDGDHADAEQDKKLILDMIKKHMGDSAESMESEGEEAAHEAYQAYCEMGKSHEEAMKCAAEAMKLAKHMQAKMKQEESEGEDAHPAGPAEAKHSEDESEMAKESEIVKLTARIAMLERELKKRELAEALDAKLRESGLGRSETDKLRALIGTPKSVEEITKTIKIFKEAFTLRGGESRAASIFTASVEKQASTEVKSGKISFTDCLK